MAGAAWAGLEESEINSPFFFSLLDFIDRCGPRKPAVLDFTHFYLILVYAVSAGVSAGASTTCQTTLKRLHTPIFRQCITAPILAKAYFVLVHM